jgi:hypothetical protein
MEGHTVHGDGDDWSAGMARGDNAAAFVAKFEDDATMHTSLAVGVFGQHKLAESEGAVCNKSRLVTLLGHGGILKVESCH